MAVLATPLDERDDMRVGIGANENRRLRGDLPNERPEERIAVPFGA
jgi:hypothetical protein